MSDDRQTLADNIPLSVTCDDLDLKIEQYIRDGYRLDMIVPADSPREALLSRDGERVKLRVPGGNATVRERGDRADEFESAPPIAPLVHTRVSASEDWVAGRAGMMYRDLVPGRLGGKLIASHIRLTQGGPVADYVHYHKVRFQMIYCLSGAIDVVYEDQGPPFTLMPGDCVLQPPEIRHRVLCAAAGSEVVEFGMPAVHETWVEHEITLPTADHHPKRIFNGQRFVRHIAASATWRTAESGDAIVCRDLGIMAATNGLADVKVWKTTAPSKIAFSTKPNSVLALHLLDGEARLTSDRFHESKLCGGECFATDGGGNYTLTTEGSAEFLEVRVKLPGDSST